MNINGYFPQAGILTSLNADKAEAIVMIPLFNQETEWCPVAHHLLYQENVQSSGLSVGAGTITNPPGTPSISFEKIEAGDEQIKRMQYGSLQVGDEVLVVFLNGDIHQPVVAARL